MGLFLAILAASAALAPDAAADPSCDDRMVECYSAAYRGCGGIAARDTDPCVIAALAACRQAIDCGLRPRNPCPPTGQHAADAGGAAPGPRPPARYRIRPTYRIDPECRPWMNLIQTKLAQAVSRFEDCLNYAHVRRDLADRMVAELTAPEGLEIQCREPPQSSWCAAGGVGLVRFSPTRALREGSICHRDIGSMFIHEVGHNANLDTSLSHNHAGEGADFDEIYSLQRYCMDNARMWLGRARRTEDVVEPSRLSCVRHYQELTPTTMQDPFWIPMKVAADRGGDSCAGR